MRSILVFISAAIIAVMGYAIYWMMTGAETPPVGRSGNRTIRPGVVALPTTTESVVGPGQGAGWDKYDPKTGLLTSRIRVDRYEQNKDGKLLVNRPVVDFFLKNGQVLRVVGERGSILLQETVGRSKSGLSATNLGQPRSGELSDVTLFILPDGTATEAGATLTMRMNNASFDNETFKIQTEAFRDSSGNLVQGDRVPVTVRGVDYEFDGTGLRLQYNEVERRLEYLRIAHGQRLLVKNFRSFQKTAKPPSERGHSPVSLDYPARLRPIEGVLLAAARPVPVGPVTRRAVPPRRLSTRPAADGEQPVYRATFKDNVEVFQAGLKLASGEELIVDFLPEEQEDGPNQKVDPSPRSSSPSTTRALTSRPAERLPESRRAVGRPVASRAATRPTTDASQQPLEIRWTGPLVVIPLPGERPARIAPGEAIVRMTGSPARPVEVVRQAGEVVTTLRCGKLTHWTLDDGAQLEEVQNLPVQMLDTRGMALRTHTMVFSQADGTAVLYGQSAARLPVSPPDAGGKLGTELMDAAWTERCILSLRGDDIVAMQVDRISLQGEVKVRHPQISLDSNVLDLQLQNDSASVGGGPATRPAQTASLKQLDANGNVRCVAQGQGGASDVRRIDCDALKLVTAPGKDGKLYAREMIAIGNVHTSDPEREMWAGNLNIVLAQPATRPASTRPATRPAGRDSLSPGELESLWAHVDVRIRTTDGKEARGDQLNIEARDGQTQVTLHGRPAVVQREKDSISGPVITMGVESQHLTIMGAGKLTGVQQAAPDKPARPVEVTWKRMLDGVGDVVDVEGDVVARSIDPDGAVNTAEGQRVRLSTTRPTTRPVVAAKPSTRPRSELDVMANRVIQSITLSGSARCDSVLNDKVGTLLRRFHVDSETIQFFQREEKAKELVIPGPGRMLFEDLRPAGDDADARERAMDPMNMRGRTAFGWKERLTYSEKASQLVMTGDVIVAREQILGEKHEPMLLQGDRIVADIVPQEQLPQVGAAGAGNAQPMNIGGIETRVQLKRVVVQGNVTVRSDQLFVVASEIEYDPAAHLLTVRGKDRQRARKLDPKTELEDASFDEMVWNTQTNQIIRATNLQAARRQ